MLLPCYVPCKFSRQLLLSTWLIMMGFLLQGASALLPVFFLLSEVNSQEQYEGEEGTEAPAVASKKCTLKASQKDAVIAVRALKCIVVEEDQEHFFSPQSFQK